MIDTEGYRPNVGIILTNQRGEVLWAKRVNQDAWQFPQGGIQRNETPLAAMYRELEEEVGLLPDHVDVVACTRGWLRYRLPKRMIRHNSLPVCIGQKQKWFLLELKADEMLIDLSLSDKPEFDQWEWVSYWYPLSEVVNFKRKVYRQALRELRPRLSRHLNTRSKKAKVRLANDNP